MDNIDIVNAVAKTVQSKLSGEGSGHDWWHVFRIWSMAKTICAKEGGDMLVVELAALLHDIADWKFNNGDDTVGPREARKILESLQVKESVIAHVEDIILNLSFKGAGVTEKMKSLEGQIVQDSDRLDALGAIGIGRTFAYGGHTGREMYNPNIKPTMHQSFTEYKNGFSPTINHFYEKLLLLKDRMNTATGRALATERHAFMEQYLENFFKEWDGKQ